MITGLRVFEDFNKQRTIMFLYKDIAQNSLIARISPQKYPSSTIIYTIVTRNEKSMVKMRFIFSKFLYNLRMSVVLHNLIM